MSAAGSVCGFWDQGAGLAGLGWAFGDSSGGLLLRRDEVAPASAELATEAGGTRLTLRADGSVVTAELEPSPVPLKDPDGDEVARAAVCAASVGIDERTIGCRGHLTSWGSDPREGNGILRHLVLPAAEDALLVVLTGARTGADTHAAERGEAWLVDPEGGASEYPEAFLTTQYDAQGLQTRAGLELWSTDAETPPMRAAGTRAGGAPAAQAGVSAAFLRTSTEGTEGIGSYLIWRG